MDTPFFILREFRKGIRPTSNGFQVELCKGGAAWRNVRPHIGGENSHGQGGEKRSKGLVENESHGLIVDLGYFHVLKTDRKRASILGILNGVEGKDDIARTYWFVVVKAR